MTNKIEKTAIIEPGVVLGSNNYIGHFAVIKSGTRIGDNNFIGHHTVVGELCQHSFNKHELNGFSPEDTHKREVIIGSGNVIREFTTVHMPTSTESTQINNNCYIMAYNHISHDTILFNNVILANNVQIGGHTVIHPFANIGLSSVIHQRSTIGAYAMVGMGSIVSKDIPPFVTAKGTPVREATKLNEWGLKRYGYENSLNAIMALYKDNDKSGCGEDLASLFDLFQKTTRRNSIEINLHI